MPRHDIGCMLGHRDKIERKASGPNSEVESATYRQAKPAKASRLMNWLLMAVMILFAACDGSDNEENNNNGDNNGNSGNPITINILTFDEISSKLAEINSAAQNTNNTVVVTIVNLGVTTAQLNALRQFVETQSAKANVTINIMGLFPAEANVTLSFADWEKMGKPTLNTTTHKWEVSTTDLPLFQAAGQTAAVATAGGNGNGNGGNQPSGRINKINYSAWNSATQQPDTIVWNEHLANAAKLDAVNDFEHDVVFVIEDMAGVPGDRKGIPATQGTFRAFGDGKLKPVRRVTNGTYESTVPIITSYAPANAWTTTSSAGGYAYAPADVSVVTDLDGHEPGVPNNVWQTIQESNEAAGSDFIPQFKATNNEAHLIPIRDSEYRHTILGVSRGTYFRLITNGTYGQVAKDLFAEQNNLTVTVNGDDVHALVTASESSTLSHPAINNDDMLKDWFQERLGLILRGSDLMYTVSTNSGKKVR